MRQCKYRSKKARVFLILIIVTEGTSLSSVYLLKIRLADKHPSTDANYLKLSVILTQNFIYKHSYSTWKPKTTKPIKSCIDHLLSEVHEYYERGYQNLRKYSKNTVDSLEHTDDKKGRYEHRYKPMIDYARTQGARLMGFIINRRSRRIDTHHHIVPEFYAQLVQEAGGDPSGWPTPSWSLQLAKENMSLLGIDFAFVSITAPGTKIYEGNIEKGRLLARKLNDYFANLVRTNAERFGFFASLLPLIDVDGAITEIDYAHSYLNADGFTLFTSYNHGKYLGHSSFEPIWTKLNEINAVVFIHPSEAPTTMVNRYMPQPLVDYPQETTRTAADIVVSGMRAKFRNVNIILSHAGGTLPFLVKRIAGAGLIRSLGCPRGPRQILSDFQSFYFDVALSSSVLQLTALLEFADPSKILFGSDVPYASLPLSLYMTKCLDSFFNKHHNKDKMKQMWYDINRNNAKTLFPKKIKE